jgi:hypothetical protein
MRLGIINSIPDYVYIGICRSFLPFSTLCLILFLTEHTSSANISTVSFVFAIAQILSQLDGGAPSYVMSSPRYGDWRMLHSGINHYAITGFKWLTLLATTAVMINIIFNYTEKNLIFTAYFLAISISLYNVAISTLIKERLWSLMTVYITLVGFFQTSLLMYIHFSEASYSPLFIVLYGFPLMLVTLTFYIYKSNVKVPVVRDHADKLQISQLASSLVVNKEYILLHIFSMHQEAALFSVVGRFISIPMQITSIYIAKIWANLDKKVKTSKEHLLKSAFTSMIISASLTFPVAIYVAIAHKEPILLILLTLLNVANAVSGVASSFSSVNPHSIPSVVWFFISILILFVLSGFLYYNGSWRLSIAVTAAYFGWLSWKLICNINWQVK